MTNITNKYRLLLLYSGSEQQRLKPNVRPLGLQTDSSQTSVIHTVMCSPSSCHVCEGSRPQMDKMCDETGLETSLIFMVMNQVSNPVTHFMVFVSMDPNGTDFGNSCSICTGSAVLLMRYRWLMCSVKVSIYMRCLTLLILYESWNYTSPGCM